MHRFIVDQKRRLISQIGEIAAALIIVKLGVQISCIIDGVLEIKRRGGGGVKRCRGLTHKGIISRQRHGQLFAIPRCMAKAARFIGEGSARGVIRGLGHGQPIRALKQPRRLNQRGNHQAVPIGENFIIAAGGGAEGALREQCFTRGAKIGAGRVAIGQ